MGCLGSTRRKLPNPTVVSNPYSDVTLNNRKQQLSFSQIHRGSIENSKQEVSEWRRGYDNKCNNLLNGSFIDSARSISMERIHSFREKPKRRDVFSVFGDQGLTLEDQSIADDDLERVDEKKFNNLEDSSINQVTITNETLANNQQNILYKSDLDLVVSPYLQIIPSLGICYGSSCQVGNGKLMEDALTVDTRHLNEHNIAFFGVYDGHDGRDVAEYLVKNLCENIIQYMKLTQETCKCVSSGCARTDLNIYEQKVHGGSTAIFCLINKEEIYLGSVGDSQAILSSKGLAKSMCVAHKPSLAAERERIEEAHGKIIGDRIFGILGVSRAFGDNDFKTSRGEFSNQFEGDLVSSEPDIVHHKIQIEDEFLVLGSDGIFDSLTAQQVVDFIRSRIVERINIQLIAEQLTQHAQLLGSMDNLSIIIICFHQHSSPYRFRRKTIERSQQMNETKRQVNISRVIV